MNTKKRINRVTTSTDDLQLIILLSPLQQKSEDIGVQILMKHDMNSCDVV
jgi:hypothetical protein